jgi:hypothetical protein
LTIRSDFEPGALSLLENHRIPPTPTFFAALCHSNEQPGYCSGSTAKIFKLNKMNGISNSLEVKHARAVHDFSNEIFHAAITYSFC